MKRSKIIFAAYTAFFGAAVFVGTASAHHGGGGGGGGGFRGPISHGSHGPNLGSQIKPVRQVLNNGPFNGGANPIKVGKPINVGGVNGGIKPTLPKIPTGPLNPTKPPFGGGIVGPIKPPKGPIGPIGPVKPPLGGGGSGPICRPSSGGHHHCNPWWPPIVLGCAPCVGGGYYGGYYPVVNNSTVVVPVATSTVVPAATTTVVNEQVATTEQPAATLAAATTPTEKLPEVPVGSTVTLNAKDLGTSGQALLVIDKLTLGVHVDEWAADHATATLPQLTISSPTLAEIVLVKADGYAASTVKVQLVPAPPAESETLGAMASLTR